jgi:hypothetical protein
VKNDNIKWCYHFPLYIFCVIIYVLIFRVLSFILSFDVIIFHCQQMLSFLFYHFPLYIFCVIIYVIIWCYHLLLSFPPLFYFSWKRDTLLCITSLGTRIVYWSGRTDHKDNDHRMKGILIRTKRPWSREQRIWRGTGH